MPRNIARSSNVRNRSLCRNDLSDRDFYSSILELVKLSQTMIDSGSAGEGEVRDLL